MADPEQIESWANRIRETIIAEPVGFIVAVIGVGIVLWILIWLIFGARLRAKDEQIKAKEEQGKIKDTTIDFLKLRLEGKPPSIKEIIEPNIETAIGLSDIAAEVAEPEENVKQYEKQNPVDVLAELRSEGIHRILNARVTNDSDWKKLEEYQKEWWNRVDTVLRDNFTNADRLNFTRLGVIPLLQFPHTYSEGHAKMLREFAIQDDRLREIIDRNIPRPS